MLKVARCNAGNDIGRRVADIDRRDLQSPTAGNARCRDRAARRAALTASATSDARRCRRDADRRCGPATPCDGEAAGHAAAPADLDHVAELLARWSARRRRRHRASRRAPASQSSTLRVPLIAAPSSSPVIRKLIEPAKSRPRAARNCSAAAAKAAIAALHVDRAAAAQRAVSHLAAERVERPGFEIARRHDVGMAGEAEIAAGRCRCAHRGCDRRRAFLGERRGVAGEAERLERSGQHDPSAPSSFGVRRA